MVVIRVNCYLKPKEAQTIAEAIHAQVARGVIVVPPYCDVFHDDKDGQGVEVYYQDDRVQELEAELAAAMEYINAQRACSTCKQFDNALRECDNVCSECQKEACFCRTCHNGSKWEWRGAK